MNWSKEGTAWLPICVCVPPSRPLRAVSHGHHSVSRGQPPRLATGSSNSQASQWQRHSACSQRSCTPVKLHLHLHLHSHITPTHSSCLDFGLFWTISVALTGLHVDASEWIHFQTFCLFFIISLCWKITDLHAFRVGFTDFLSIVYVYSVYLNQYWHIF